MVGKDKMNSRMTWLNMREEFPGLKGTFIHFLNARVPPLRDALIARGFAVCVLRGSEVSDEVSFFREVREALRFPPYFGGTWDAWNDSLGMFGRSLIGRAAVIWTDADRTFLSAPSVLTNALFDLQSLAASLEIEISSGRTNEARAQLAIFCLGHAKGFQRDVAL
jgi:hypothetical protein